MLVDFQHFYNFGWILLVLFYLGIYGPIWVLSLFIFPFLTAPVLLAKFLLAFYVVQILDTIEFEIRKRMLRMMELRNSTDDKSAL